MFALMLLACRVELGAPGPEAQSAGGTTEVWVYTSMYEEVIAALEPEIKASFPQLNVRWYQAGSEKVAQRAEAEWEAGSGQACLIMTSDPFWYADLAARGRLRRYVPPEALGMDRSWVAATHSTARLSVMVLAANESLVPEGERPSSFRELADERFRDRVSMPDPLSSGTAFTTLAFLQSVYGWDFVQALRANGLVAAGGNSSVLQRVESGERPIGVLLLENVLKARSKGSPILPIVPSDGAVAIPGPVAITADCAHPLEAQALADWMLEPRAQQAIVGGFMHSPFPDQAPPSGGPGLESLNLLPWTTEFTAAVSGDAAAIKERYARIAAGP